MVDIDLAQSTFEYMIRKRMNEGKLPADKSYVICDGRHYMVDWKKLKVYQLWDKLIDESFISTLEEDDLESVFEEVIDTFTNNLSVLDLKAFNDEEQFNSDKKLSDLPNWVPVKVIPKNYFKI